MYTFRLRNWHFYQPIFACLATLSPFQFVGSFSWADFSAFRFFASDWKSCAILHLSNKSCEKFSANVISFDWFPALKSRHWLGQRNSKASVPASLTHPLNVLTHKKFSVYDPLSFLSDVHLQNGWNQHKCWQNIKCSIQLIHTHTHNCTHICKITSYHRNTPHGFWMVVLKMQDTHIYRISS